jgi:hypothetical protein
MLCLQDCIDMCDVSPDEETKLKEVTLAEISEVMTLGDHQDEDFPGAPSHRSPADAVLFEITPDVYRGSPVLHSVRR